MKKNIYLIIDFDSTIVGVEALDTLSEIVLESHPQKTRIVEDIKRITTLGMDGKITFDESLQKRLSLFLPSKKSINILVERLRNNISESFLRNKNFLTKHRDEIYVISGGFREYILPVIRDLGLREDHVIANNFVFDNKGNAVGYNADNLLAKAHGKVLAVRDLNLQGIVIVIGDGFTDYEVFEQNVADRFIAYLEYVKRPDVVKKASTAAHNFEEVLEYLKTVGGRKRGRVLLLENIHKRAQEMFTKAGFEVISLPRALGESELREKIKDIDILGIRSKTIVTKDVLTTAKKLKVIGAFCIGTDQIDLSEAYKQNIAVFNAPFSNTRSVVELALGEIIMLHRHAFQKSLQMHQGVWNKSAVGSHEVRGRTLGIIGYGHIGSQLSVLAEAMGMKVLYFDIKDRLSFGTAKKCESLEELLSQSDVVSVHVDGRKENKGLIGKREFSLMKDGVFFLNLSRGKVVDTTALVEALQAGKVAGAAVDVFPDEPEKSGDGFTTPLQGIPNVILTPHIAGSTEESQQQIAEFVSRKLLSYIEMNATMVNDGVSVKQDVDQSISFAKGGGKVPLRENR